MYQHGKPIYRFSRRSLVIIIAIILLLIGGSYYYIIVKVGSRSSLKNNNNPLISTIKASNLNTEVDEPTFSVTLPGKWRLEAKDWDARYHAWQWQLDDKKSAGRLFRVYQDTIPTDYAYNYLLPVTAVADSVETGQISGNCTDFTATPQTPHAIGSVMSKWQGVSFLCEYGNQIHQVVGTGSLEGINTVTLKGSKEHKFFFLYQDSNITADYGLMSNILSTFHAK
jgi:hypothetical protein